jgi:cytochrome c oxidase cbb3-type subunit 3
LKNDPHAANSFTSLAIRGIARGQESARSSERSLTRRSAQTTTLPGRSKQATQNCNVPSVQGNDARCIVLAEKTMLFSYLGFLMISSLVYRVCVRRKHRFALAVLVFTAALCYAQGSKGQQAAVAKPVADSSTSVEQIQAGKALFASQCSFCHGRDAGGGESGPDLTASPLVEQDVHGDKIGVVVRNGRVAKGMPAFGNVDDQQLAALVAFIHDRKANAKEGRRRTVDVADLQTGNAEAGMRYFNGAGGCAKCHSASGDLAGIGGRVQGLELLKRMLYRENERAEGRSADSSKATPTATITFASGQTVSGKLAYRDEFTIGVIDSSGWYRSWPVTEVKFTVTNPLEAHVEQLGKYTDEDIHSVLAYLETLR